MKSREYERRRVALEEQLQADLDLIRAGYQAKLRALEMVWLSSPDGEMEERSVSAESLGVETVLPNLPAVETVSSERVETVEKRATVRRGDLPGDIEAVLPGLPAVFDKRDLSRALGYEPARASLYRALNTLQRENLIAIDTFSGGGHRTRYRKI